jgi:hypothetical protein
MTAPRDGEIELSTRDRRQYEIVHRYVGDEESREIERDSLRDGLAGR